MDIVQSLSETLTVNEIVSFISDINQSLSEILTINETVIYDAIKTLSEILTVNDNAEASVLAGIYANLQATWAMNEVSGVRYDNSGKGNNLSDYNTVGSVAGKISNAAYFVKANSECLYRVPWNPGDIDFTFAGWVYLRDKSVNQHILYEYATGASRYRLLYNKTTDTFRFSVSTDGTNNVYIDAGNLGSPAINTWYWICCYHDSVNNKIGIKINALAANTEGFYGGIYTGGTDHEFVIGAWSKTLGPADVNVDSTQYWTRLLSDDEKAYMYNSGNGREL